MQKAVFVIAINIIVVIILLLANGLITPTPISNKPDHQAMAQTLSSSSSSSFEIPNTTAAATKTDYNTTSTNFLTYENSIYGIKIHYPSGWTYKENEDTSTSSNNNDNNNTSTQDTSIPVQTVASFTPISSLTRIATSLNIGVQDFKIRGLTADLFADIMMANKDKFLPPGADIIESSSTTVAGNPAHKFVFAQGTAKGMIVFTIKENKAYYIFYGSRLPVQYSTYLPTAQKMIDSFQIVPAVSNNNNNINYSEFIGRGLSFKYPKEWIINSTANYLGIDDGSEEIEISELPGNQLKSRILIDLFPLTRNEMEKMNLQENMTQQDIDSRVEQLFSEYMFRPVISHIKRGTITELQKPVYDKYVIDGHKAGSSIFTTNYGDDISLRTLYLGTIIGRGNKGFSMAYNAPVDFFNQNLPIVENILKSMKFSK